MPSSVMQAGSRLDSVSVLEGFENSFLNLMGLTEIFKLS
jgi:hypothetical protein